MVGHVILNRSVQDLQGKSCRGSGVSRVFPGLMFPRAESSTFEGSATLSCHNKALISSMIILYTWSWTAVKRFTFAVKETLITCPSGEECSQMPVGGTFITPFYIIIKTAPAVNSELTFLNLATVSLFYSLPLSRSLSDSSFK